MRFGRALGELLRPGDLVLLSGPLGAGKTTMTRGIAEGMGVSGRVSSPTFVLARVHPAGESGVPLVHVDAYRWAVTWPSWRTSTSTRNSTGPPRGRVGRGYAEQLSEDYLVVRLDRRPDDVRVVTLEPHGAWVTRLAEARLAG
jgi:tRNA threonylcarbamoyladenosine biosynthesis protein TsaE